MALGRFLRLGTSLPLNTSDARGSTSRRGYRFLQHVCSVRSVVTTYEADARWFDGTTRWSKELPFTARS